MIIDDLFEIAIIEGQHAKGSPDDATNNHARDRPSARESIPLLQRPIDV